MVVAVLVIAVLYPSIRDVADELLVRSEDAS
jgi:hypothetical protein